MGEGCLGVSGGALSRGEWVRVVPAGVRIV